MEKEDVVRTLRRVDGVHGVHIRAADEIDRLRWRWNMTLACVAYVSAMVLANLSIARFGVWVSPINAFLLIGLDLSLRDYIHDNLAKRGGVLLRMLAIIAVAGAVSYALNPAAGRIAVASAASFMVAAVVDMGVYHAMRHRHYLARSNTSNVFAALVDSVLFPTLAFGAFFPGVILAQTLAKVFGGGAWSVVLNYARK